MKLDRSRRSQPKNYLLLWIVLLLVVILVLWYLTTMEQ